MPKPYNHRDPLMFKAYHEGYRARSVYKLEELDKKFRLIHPDMSVLDIGAAPGSWLQYVSERIDQGTVLGVDLQQIEPIPGVATEILDITDKDKTAEILTKYKINKVDLILSDIAPNTSGIAYRDQLLSVELNQAIFEVAKNHLKPGGKLVMKVFPGEHFTKFLKQLKSYFKDVSVQKVTASRESSREVYVVCARAQH
jgi:23S rRNA (uridine2552-2'-O)-methyltransferase